MEDDVVDGAEQTPRTRARHIKKRALKNKALSVIFDEKDLKNYITGFHKRKKKRRKEAQKKQEESLRRKRIEQRKKRKLERELALYGGARPTDDVEVDESEELAEDEETDPRKNTLGTAVYDTGNTMVTVTTSEISREEEDGSTRTIRKVVEQSAEVSNKRQSVPVQNKKSFKKVAKQKPHRKISQKRKDRHKGKKHGKKRN